MDLTSNAASDGERIDQVYPCAVKAGKRPGCPQNRSRIPARASPHPGPTWSVGASRSRGGAPGGRGQRRAGFYQEVELLTVRSVQDMRVRVAPERAGEKS